MSLWTRRTANTLVGIGALGTLLSIIGIAVLDLQNTPWTIAVIMINIALLAAGVVWHISHPVRRNH